MNTQDFTNQLPEVLVNEQNSMQRAVLMNSGRVIAILDIQSIEGAHFNAQILTRLVQMSTQVLRCLISAQDLITVVGLDWPDAEIAKSLVNMIEDPNSEISEV